MRTKGEDEITVMKLGRFDIGQFKIANLYNIYLGMNPKEQTVALVVAVVVVLLVLILPVTVASSRIGRLEKDVSRGRDQLREIMRAIEAYDGKTAELKQLQKMVGGGFDSSISSTLETIAETSGLKDKIDALKEKASAPSEIFDEASVDVRLKKVGLQQLVGYLNSIENNPNTLLRLKSLSIKTRFDNKQELNAAFTVSTYRLLEGTEEGI